MNGEPDPAAYGKHWAEYYDEIYPHVGIAAIELLAGLTGEPARMLELAVGTGRFAIPLAEAGVRVVGIDASPEMVGKLREKAGGEAIEVHIGDFAFVDVPERFPLIFLGFNTLFVLLTQERQVECFMNVAEHLEPGGRFVIEAFVPDPGRFGPDNTRMEVSSIASDSEHTYEMSVHDPVEQTTVTHWVKRLATGETVILPVTVRYAWPTEIDLMARLAGLELEHRWDWYDRRPFTETSGQHVSVYRKAE